MTRLSRTTRPFRRTWSETSPVLAGMPGDGTRPLAGGTVAMPSWFKPQGVPGGLVYAGMDPSDPSTYVRPWRPVPGMVARFNFDGAQVQGETETGGVWGLPAWRQAVVAGRPPRRMR